VLDLNRIAHGAVVRVRPAPRLSRFLRCMSVGVLGRGEGCLPTLEGIVLDHSSFPVTYIGEKLEKYVRLWPPLRKV